MKIEILIDGSYIKHGCPKSPYQLTKGDRQDFPDKYALTLIDMEAGIEVKGIIVQVVEAVKDVVSPQKEEIKATAHVKKFALDSGVDLTLISATGNDGKILKSDVENYINSQRE